MNKIIKSKVDGMNIESKIIENEIVIAGKQYHFTFIMTDLDAGELITARHCVTIEQAQKFYDKVQY